jgi:hypothetical protein
MSHRLSRISLIAFSTVVAGCQSTDPVAYSALSSATYLKPNTSDRSGRVPFSYNRQVNWSSYRSVIIDPVTIYRGVDNQFGKMEEKDKAFLADYMKTEFTRSLSKRFSIVTTPTDETLRVKLTLAGAKTNTPGLTTVAKFDLAGGAYNVVQAARGKEGAMSGSVNYAVEIYDAGSNRLLAAYVMKQYPSALNVSASWSRLDASMVGIKKGADVLVEQMQ